MSLADSLAQLAGLYLDAAFLGSVAGLFWFFFGCHLAPLLPCAPELHKTADGPPRNEGISIVQS